MKKKNKFSAIILPDFKIHYKAIIIKIVWYWYKNRHTEQRNRKKRVQKINLFIYGSLIFEKVPRTLKGNMINCIMNWDFHMKKNEFRLFSYHIQISRLKILM